MLNNRVRCEYRLLISIRFSWIHWLSSPDFTSGMWYVLVASSKPVRGIGPTTLNSKISSTSTIETRPFWPYSYILWKVVYKNVRYMCIILVANIIWRSGHALRPSTFVFLHHYCRSCFDVTAAHLPIPSEYKNKLLLIGYLFDLLMMLSSTKSKKVTTLLETLKTVVPSVAFNRGNLWSDVWKKTYWKF